MFRLEIPGRERRIEIEHLVLDVNGTIMLDGELITGVAEEIARFLLDGLHVVAITADTHGVAAALSEQTGIDVKVIERGDEEAQKAAYVRWLGAERVVAIGNGANDVGMLAAAAIGICVIGPEGAAGQAVCAADAVTGDIEGAFALLQKPSRLVATLRR